MSVIIQWVNMLISGVQSLISFISEVPTYLGLGYSLMPPTLELIFVSCIALVVAVRIIELLP